MRSLRVRRDGGILLLAGLLWAGCDGGGYRVVVGFEPPALSADVTRVTVALVARCDAQPVDGGDAVDAFRAMEITRDGASEELGSVRAGSYGLYARGFDGDCGVVASGCAQVELVEGGEGDLRVDLVPTAGPSCAAPATCVSGMCVEPGIDAGRPPDAGDADAAEPDARARLDAGPPDAGCTAACSAGVETACGPDGPVMHTCALGCADATRCIRVEPSNVERTLTDPSAADLSVASGTWDTTTCDDVATMTIVPQTGGPDVCVVRTGAFSVTGTLLVRGALPLVVLAEGQVTIGGTLDVSASLGTPGAGGFEGGTASRPDGLGPQAGLAGLIRDGDEDGGGGGAGACGDGGRGGRGDSATGGDAGRAIASVWMLEPLFGGSGGGIGPNEGTTAVALGGAGGGAVQITSQAGIAIDGRLLAGGGGGGAGREGGFGVSEGAGGGGGSGGTVLLEAPTVSLGGAAQVNANGGGGGAGFADAMGTAGQDGAASFSRPAGGAVLGADGGEGGDGGASTSLAGFQGQDANGAGGNGGGGGGGAGCIFVRSAVGTTPSGAFSPSASLGLRAATVRTY